MIIDRDSILAYWLSAFSSHSEIGSDNPCYQHLFGVVTASPWSLISSHP